LELPGAVEFIGFESPGLIISRGWRQISPLLYIKKHWQDAYSGGQHYVISSQ